MPDAARKGDSLLHGTSLDGAGCTTVKIGGSEAWRVGDFHSCSVKNIPPTGGPPSVPHVGGSVLKGSFTVLIGSMPAARKTDIVVEPAAMPPTTPWLPNNIIQAGEGTVNIGDIAFGLMDPAVLARFCAEWRQLRQDWPHLTEAQRQQRTEQMVNNALAGAGAPPVAGIADTAPASAQAVFNPWTNSAGAANTIAVPAGTFANNAIPAGSLGGTLFHEARHVTQWYANAQYLASYGWNAAQISARTGVASSVAQAAVANPAGLNTAAGHFGAMNDNQSYGNGSQYNNDVRNNQTQVHNTHGPNSQQYGDALTAYWTLPNERDAEDANDALKAICPDAQ